MHVRLAIIGKGESSAIARVVDSARHLVQSACIIITPKNYACLPEKGLEMPTYVHQVPWEKATRSKLYELASKDPEVDFVLMVGLDDSLSPLTEGPLANVAASDVDTSRTPFLVDVRTSASSS